MVAIGSRTVRICDVLLSVPGFLLRPNVLEFTDCLLALDALCHRAGRAGPLDRARGRAVRSALSL